MRAGLGAAAVATLGAAGVATGLLPGRSLITGPDLPSGVPHTRPGPTSSGTFASSAMHRTIGWTLSRPPGFSRDRLHPLVVLHGRGGDHRSAFGGGLHLDRYLAAAVAGGAAPFAIASVDGGDHSYWHARADGTDPATMVVREFLPLLAAQGVDVGRWALLGWSMGAYGALLLAGTAASPGTGIPPIAAVVAESPAVWSTAGASAAGAFDDAEDWTRHDIWPLLPRLDGRRLWIGCGSGDGFAAVTGRLRTAVHPTPAGEVSPGGHDDSYWRSRAAEQLRFVAGRW